MANLLSQTIKPGTLLSIKPENIKGNTPAEIRLFYALGGKGLSPDIMDDEDAWLIYGKWAKNSERFIISSDMIERVVQSPQFTALPLTADQMATWMEVNNVRG